MQVANGAIVQYEGKWSATPKIGAVELMRLVSAALGKDALAVKDSSNDADFLQSTTIPFIGASLTPFKVTLKLQVSNGLGYSSEDDIINVVRHEVFTITESYPVADSITSVQNPNQVAVPTGQPNIDGTGNGGDDNVSWWDGITHLFSDTKILFAGLGIGLVVAVLLIAHPPRR